MHASLSAERLGAPANFGSRDTQIRAQLNRGESSVLNADSKRLFRAERLTLTLSAWSFFLALVVTLLQASHVRCRVAQDNVAPVGSPTSLAAGAPRLEGNTAFRTVDFAPGETSQQDSQFATGSFVQPEAGRGVDPKRRARGTGGAGSGARASDQPVFRVTASAASRRVVRPTAWRDVSGPHDDDGGKTPLVVAAGILHLENAGKLARASDRNATQTERRSASTGLCPKFSRGVRVQVEGVTGGESAAIPDATSSESRWNAIDPLVASQLPEVCS